MTEPTTAELWQALERLRAELAEERGRTLELSGRVAALESATR